MGGEAHIHRPLCLHYARLIGRRASVCAHTHLHVSVCVSSLLFVRLFAYACAPRERMCVSDCGCIFMMCTFFFSLPSPGVPVRTPRRPCARLPKTSASPGPPRGRGQPNVTWTLYRVVSGGQEEARGEEGGDGELNERGTKVKEERRGDDRWMEGVRLLLPAALEGALTL